jgi:hypothetical protein
MMTLLITPTNITTFKPYSCYRITIIITVTSLEAGWTGFGVLAKGRNFSVRQKSPDRLWELLNRLWALLNRLWALLNPLFNKYCSSSLEVKWPRLEDDHSVPRLRMSGSTPLLRYMPSWCGWEQFFILHYFVTLPICTAAMAFRVASRYWRRVSGCAQNVRSLSLI